MCGLIYVIMYDMYIGPLRISNIIYLPCGLNYVAQPTENIIYNLSGVWAHLCYYVWYVA